MIAVMLGHLRMSVQDCETAYLKIMERAFVSKRAPKNVVGRAKDTWKMNGRFDTEELELAIKEMITRCGLDTDALLQDPQSPCKV